MCKKRGEQGIFRMAGEETGVFALEMANMTVAVPFRFELPPDYPTTTKTTVFLVGSFTSWENGKLLMQKESGNG